MKSAVASNQHWQQRPEGGSITSLRFIRWLALTMGPRIAHLCLYPITAYFLIVRPMERRASRAYLRRALGREPSLLHIAKHMHTFATTILDRVFLLSGRFASDRVRIHGLPTLLKYLNAQRGVLLFSAHFGSFEAARTVGFNRDDLLVRIFMDHRHNAKISMMLDALNPRAKASVIDIGGDSTQGLLQIHETLQAGGLVGVMADRARDDEHTVNCQLLDATVAMPSAPFRLAAALHHPVMLIFGILRDDNTYDVCFEEFADDIVLGKRGERDQVLQQWMQRYADRLGQQIRSAPYNWFNFYDYWAGSTRHAK